MKKSRKVNALFRIYAAKVQQKKHICKKIGVKIYFSAQIILYVWCVLSKKYFYF